MPKKKSTKAQTKMPDSYEVLVGCTDSEGNRYEPGDVIQTKNFDASDINSLVKDFNPPVIRPLEG